MPVYSISYDISEKSKSSYEEIEKAITSNCSGWCKYAETSWIVSFSGNAQTLSDAIEATGFGNDDKLLVIKVLNEKQGLLTKEEWNTINSFFK